MPYSDDVGPSAAPLSERDRAVRLARHLRETEGLTIPEIAVRLGRSPSTVAGYFSDPDGERARRYKAKYRGRCERCGAPTAAKAGVRLCRSCWRRSVAAQTEAMS
jgi:ribosomal protein S14